MRQAHFFKHGATDAPFPKLPRFVPAAIPEQARLSEVWQDPPVSGSKAETDAYRKAAKEGITQAVKVLVALTDDPQHDPVPYEDRVGVFLRMLQFANSVSAQLQDARDALTRAEEKENKAWSVLQNAKVSYARASFVTTTSRKSVQQIRQTFYGQDEYYQHGENFDQIEVDEDDDCWNRRGQDPEPPWQAQVAI